jgi:aspartate ammonia-lyase
LDRLRRFQLTNGTRLFTERCIDGLVADRETSLRNLMESSALATGFVAKLGYEATTALVKESLRQKRPLSALAVESGLLTDGDIVASLYRSAGVPLPSE